MATVSFLQGNGIANLRQRIADMARAAGDLTPLQDPVRKILVDGNTERALAGVDPQGRKYERLRPSTLKRRKGNGPPLAPRGASSRVVTDYVPVVQAGPGRLTFTGTWPDEPWMEYHQTGTRHMAARPPYGFREQDLAKVRDLLRRHVRGGRGLLGRLFG